MFKLLRHTLFATPQNVRFAYTLHASFHEQGGFSKTLVMMGMTMVVMTKRYPSVQSVASPCYLQNKKTSNNRFIMYTTSDTRKKNKIMFTQQCIRKLKCNEQDHIRVVRKCTLQRKVMDASVMLQWHGFDSLA